MTDEVSHAALARLVRDEGSRVLATLVRTTGSLPLAQDAVQDAVVRALEVWPVDGVPTEPRAWLTLVARRRAIDLLRREQSRENKEREAVLDPAAGQFGALDSASLPDDTVVRDDLLRLIFTCCHPSLDVATQTALALRTLCGLTTAEVAAALLVDESAMAKRLTRARRKIAVAGIPYRVPDALPARLRGVLLVVYLLFNEGYAATGGDDPVRSSLCDEALRLARLLVDLRPTDQGALGLLALFLLQDARRPGRVDSAGDTVLLAEQDRSLWDREKIGEGVGVLGIALRQPHTEPDVYVVQAAIAACHDLAARWEDTDWPAILSWYDVLLTLTDTAVIRLNRAVALAQVSGPGAALDEVARLTELDRYPPMHAARAELLAELGRHAEAVASWDRALQLGVAPAVERHVQRRQAQSRRAALADRAV